MGRKVKLLAIVVLFAASPLTSAEEPPTAPPPPAGATFTPPTFTPPTFSPPVAAPAPAAAAPTAAATAPAPAAAAAPEWTSMSRAGVARPLPPQGPMAFELGAKLPPAKWAEVPPPPQPAQAEPQKTAKPARGKAGKAPPATAAKGSLAAAAVAAPPAAAPAVAEAPPSVAPAALEASPPPAWAPPVYEAPGAAPAEGAAQGGNPNDPKVKFAADQTGVMLSVTQDLESDKIRQSWAQSGGVIQAFEANAGAMFMYKDMAKEAGEGAYMSGAGLNGGFRVSILNLEAPKYETRDTTWTAFKIGGGADIGAMGVTINIPVECYPYVGCVGGPQNASMSSFTLVGTLGIMKAFGSFDSPREWSGWAVGAEWAPSYQSTTLTMEGADPQTSSSFNATGFALNFESGSLQSMAAKMGKKAHIKVRLFMLPAVGDLPLLMTASIGAVWY